MLDFLGSFERTHMCGDLRAADAGQQVVVMGWVNRRRDHGRIGRGGNDSVRWLDFGRGSGGFGRFRRGRVVAGGGFLGAAGGAGNDDRQQGGHQNGPG